MAAGMWRASVSVWDLGNGGANSLRPVTLILGRKC